VPVRAHASLRASIVACLLRCASLRASVVAPASSRGFFDECVGRRRMRIGEWVRPLDVGAYGVHATERMTT